jgi:hypothetical protein
MLDPSERLLPLSSVARLMRVRPAWLASEAEAGRIPALRAGDRWLCDPAAVEAALLARARQIPGEDNNATDDAEPRADGAGGEP